MSRKPLSKEEIMLLRSSPYIAKVTLAGGVSFTPEFKKGMYEGLTIGKTLRQMLQEHSIDPEILGETRLWGIASNLRANAEREGGFEDLRRKNGTKPSEGSRGQTLTERIAQLEHELAYTRQEVEFLKKIHTADLEARKEWESQPRRK